MGRKKETRNILDMIPLRSYEWEEKEGTVSIKVPKFRSKLLCDGKRTVRDIGNSLKEKFREDVEPVYERIAELFNIMEANRLISYKRNK